MSFLLIYNFGLPLHLIICNNAAKKSIHAAYIHIYVNVGIGIYRYLQYIMNSKQVYYGVYIDVESNIILYR